MIDRHTALKFFLRRAAMHPFQYGEWDCAMTAANWIEICCGVDPARTLRGRYHTKGGWLRIVKRHGGLPKLVGSLVQTVGLEITQKPQEGDIAVIDLPNVGHAVGIRTERGWAFKLDKYLLIVTDALPLITAWRT